MIWNRTFGKSHNGFFPTVTAQGSSRLRLQRVPLLILCVAIYGILGCFDGDDQVDQNQAQKAPLESSLKNAQKVRGTLPKVKIEFEEDEIFPSRSYTAYVRILQADTFFGSRITRAASDFAEGGI